MPFLLGELGPSTSPILQARKGIFALRHAHPTKIIGVSRLSAASDATTAGQPTTHAGRLARVLRDGRQRARHQGPLMPTFRTRAGCLLRRVAVPAPAREADL